MALVAAGCFHGAKSFEVEGTGEWTQWTVANSGHFGGYTDLTLVNAIMPRTAQAPWTAVGHTVDLGGDRQPKAWTSADGLSWDTEDLPTDQPYDRVETATRHGRSLVVGGIHGEQGDGGVVAWHRGPDGVWSQAAAGPVLHDVGGAAPGPTGVVLAGSHLSPAGSAIALARSADGSRWTQASESGLEAREGRMVDALGYATSGKREVVVGVEVQPTAAPTDSWEHDPGIWWSAGDGRWSRPAQVERWARDSVVQGLHEVIAFRLGFVAVGQAAGPIACLSRDGRTWERRTIGPAGGVALDVVVVGGKVVAVGTIGERLAVWSSRDGLIWNHVPLPDELTRLSGIWVSAAGGPDGELAIAVHDEDESEVYIGRP